MSVRVIILGSGGGAPSLARETACVLVRHEDRALLLDIGSGARRLLTNPILLEGASTLDVVLTHFHFDHVCGLPYLPMLPINASIWAPGRWLYGTASARILAPLREPPIAPTDVTNIYPINELNQGTQTIAGFDVRAGPQLRHWAPTAGLRIDETLALITDTPYEPASAQLAEGVTHLLHEAWSSSQAPIYPDRDATAADAARVAREATVGQLILIHLNPKLTDDSILLADAAPVFDRVTLGTDENELVAA